MSKEIKRRKKILCIDDEKKVLSALKRVFYRTEYEVVTACDGNDGLLKVISEKPDIIILDVKMPHVDGYQFLSYLKDKKLDHIPAVIFSGEKTMNDIFRGFNRGGVYYITKPTKSEYIMNIVEYLVGDISEKRKQELESLL